MPKNIPCAPLDFSYLGLEISCSQDPKPTFRVCASLVSGLSSSSSEAAMAFVHSPAAEHSWEPVLYGASHGNMAGLGLPGSSLPVPSSIRGRDVSDWLLGCNKELG